METGLYIPPDQNITNFSTGHQVQRVTINQNFLMVEDPWQGDFVVGGPKEPFYYDFFTTPNAMRSLGVSQLCKDEASGTIPNLASFTRNWHILGLHGFVEHFSHRRNVAATDEQRLAWHVYAEGDDQAQPGFSHALELAVQRWGGPQNYHEEIWPTIARRGGTVQALEKHGIPYNDKIEVPGVEIPCWINDKRPDMDVDNYQYIGGEGLLWFDHDGADPEVRERVRSAVDPKKIEITEDGKMAFRNVEDALVFSKMLLLFSTEHWNDPINRIQLHFLIHASQRAIVRRRIAWMDEVDKGETRRPESYLHLIDDDVVRAMDTGPGRRDDLMYVIKHALYSIAIQERKRFIDYKLPEYSAFLIDDRARNLPSEYLSPKRVEFGPRSSSVSAEPCNLTAEERERIGAQRLPLLSFEDGAISYTAGPLKNRFVDPLVKKGDAYVRLSQISEDYKNLLVEQEHLQQQGVKVQLIFAPEYTEAFREGIEQNQREFEEVHDRTELTPDQARRIIEIGAKRATSLAVASGRVVLRHPLGK